MIPGANLVIIEATAIRIKDGKPCNVVSAIRSNKKQRIYNSKYFPAVLKRFSDKISTNGIRLSIGFTMFIIPSLLVLNIKVVIVTSISNLVRGSSKRPFSLFTAAGNPSSFIRQFLLFQNVFSVTSDR